MIFLHGRHLQDFMSACAADIVSPLNLTLHVFDLQAEAMVGEYRIAPAPLFYFGRLIDSHKWHRFLNSNFQVISGLISCHTQVLIFLFF